MLCYESVPRFFDSLSVRLMFQKVDMCAPCNAVFTEPPHQVSAHCIHGTEGKDEISQFTAALSSVWQPRRKGNWWKSYTTAQVLCLIIRKCDAKIPPQYYSTNLFSEAVEAILSPARDAMLERE